MQFTEQFNRFVCFGDSISVEIDGTTFTARLEPDTDSRPHDDDCYSKHSIQRWLNDEWYFAGIVISAERNGWTRDHIDSLWGVEINFGDDDRPHLMECANDCLAQAIEHLTRIEHLAPTKPGTTQENQP